MFLSQTKVGDTDRALLKNIKPVIIIDLLGQNLFKNIEDYHSYFNLIGRTENGFLIKDFFKYIEIHIIECAKIYDKIKDIKDLDQIKHNSLLKWCMYFSGPNILEAEMADDVFFKHLKDAEKEFLADPKRMREYLRELIADKTYQMDLEDAQERGEVRANRKTAKNMLKEGCDLNLISRVTGLSIEEIIKLKASLAI